MTKIILLKNKVTLLLLQSFLFSFFCTNSINIPEIDDTFKSNILLYFTPNKIIKKTEEEYFLPVLYLGNLYEAVISSHFGGQLILKDWNIQNKYYVVVSDKIDLLLDNNDCIKGYKIHPDNAAQSKMYVMYLIITINEKNDMTYNWNIEEIAIPERSLPDNTIIIYCNPADINFTGFDKKFNKTYPNTSNQNSAVIILPQASFDSKNLLANSLKQHTANINTMVGHKKITPLEKN